MRNPGRPATPVGHRRLGKLPATATHRLTLQGRHAGPHHRCWRPTRASGSRLAAPGFDRYRSLTGGAAVLDRPHRANSRRAGGQQPAGRRRPVSAPGAHRSRITLASYPSSACPPPRRRLRRQARGPLRRAPRHAADPRRHDPSATSAAAWPPPRRLDQDLAPHDPSGADEQGGGLEASGEYRRQVGRRRFPGWSPATGGEPRARRRHG